MLAYSTFTRYFNSLLSYVERLVSVVQLRHCSTEAVSQTKLSEFVLLYKSDPITVPYRLMFSSSSSWNISEFLQSKSWQYRLSYRSMRKTLVAREALKSAPLTIPLRYRPELFHKQLLYSHVEILFIIETLSISFSPRPKQRRELATTSWIKLCETCDKKIKRIRK